MNSQQGLIDMAGVPEILRLGLIGFAFLMLVLTYMLLREVVVQERPARGSVALSVVFMVVAAACVGLVAYLEFGARSVTVRVQLYDNSWDPQRYGKVHLFRPGSDGAMTPLSFNERIEAVLIDREAVMIALYEVIDAIDTMQQQLLAADEQRRLRPSEELRESLGDGI